MSPRHLKWGMALLAPILLVVPLYVLNHNLQKAQLRKEIQRLTSPGTMLASAGGDIDVNGRTASGEPLLCLAARRNDTTAAKLLVKAGADLEQRDRDGNTALIIAASYESQEALTLLIGSGANLNARNHRGKSALGTLWGSFKQSSKILAMTAELRAAGAKI